MERERVLGPGLGRELGPAQELERQNLRSRRHRCRQNRQNQVRVRVRVRAQEPELAPYEAAQQQVSADCPQAPHSLAAHQQQLEPELRSTSVSCGTCKYDGA